MRWQNPPCTFSTPNVRNYNKTRLILSPVIQNISGWLHSNRTEKLHRSIEKKRKFHRDRKKLTQLEVGVWKIFEIGKFRFSFSYKFQWKNSQFLRSKIFRFFISYFFIENCMKMKIENFRSRKFFRPQLQVALTFLGFDETFWFFYRSM